eukprot:TRINITY_DN729_c0_g1_i1.p2 TRINITY_DN729_c0_g1~~TRINITY_DN729_c0_g1_i1.p2  ORF type:complete len:193 (+),score=7.14 TRINITY_DN729_c0_g1_i1:113-691(+)
MAMLKNALSMYKSRSEERKNRIRSEATVVPFDTSASSTTSSPFASLPSTPSSLHNVPDVDVVMLADTHSDTASSHASSRSLGSTVSAGAVTVKSAWDEAPRIFQLPNTPVPTPPVGRYAPPPPDCDDEVDSKGLAHLACSVSSSTDSSFWRGRESHLLTRPSSAMSTRASAAPARPDLPPPPSKATPPVPLC